MTTQLPEYKCVSCGAVSTDADSFAKHKLVHDTGMKPATNHPVLDSSWQSPASTGTQA